MSKLYQFTLPCLDNRQRSYEKARKAWEAKAMDLAGGLTILPLAEGAWKSPETGKIYRETVARYDVACDRAVALALVQEACELFPDQEAIFYAELGVARLVYPERKETAA